MPTVFDVAKVFLSLESMSHKKLQKLCYYTKAWHLALYDENIIDESFEAWVHGPVCPVLYQEYKEYGWEDIPRLDSLNGVPTDVTAFVNEVYESYGELDAYDLESLSHKETPWVEARGNRRPWQSCNTVISEETMKEYYRSIMVQ